MAIYLYMFQINFFQTMEIITSYKILGNESKMFKRRVCTTLQHLVSIATDFPSRRVVVLIFGIVLQVFNNVRNFITIHFFDYIRQEESSVRFCCAPLNFFISIISWRGRGGGIQNEKSGRGGP